LQNTENEANLLPLSGIQKLKGFQLQALLCPWDPAGGSTQTPEARDPRSPCVHPAFFDQATPLSAAATSAEETHQTIIQFELKFVFFNINK